MEFLQIEVLSLDERLHFIAGFAFDTVVFVFLAESQQFLEGRFSIGELVEFCAHSQTIGVVFGYFELGARLLLRYDFLRGSVLAMTGMLLATVLELRQKLAVLFASKRGELLE